MTRIFSKTFPCVFKGILKSDTRNIFQPLPHKYNSSTCLEDYEKRNGHVVHYSRTFQCVFLKMQVKGLFHNFSSRPKIKYFSRTALLRTLYKTIYNHRLWPLIKVKTMTAKLYLHGMVQLGTS